MLFVKTQSLQRCSTCRIVNILTCAAAFLCICIVCPEASEIRVSDFLATSENDYVLDPQNEKMDFLYSSSSNTPFFDRIELRTQTDQFEFSRQKYSLRFYTNGWNVTGNAKKLYNATLQSTRTKRDLLFHQALKRRYVLLIDFLHTRNMLALQRKLKKVYGDRVTVLKSRKNKLDFDVNNLLMAEDSHMEAQIKVMDMENSIRRIEDKIRQYVPVEGAVEFDTDNLTDIDFIRETIWQTGFSTVENNIYLKQSSSRLELAKNRYELEKSENRKYVRYLEVSYNNNKRHDATEAYSVGLAISLPFINSGRIEINRMKLQFLTAKSRYEVLKRMLAENFKMISSNLENLVRQYGVLMGKNREGIAESALKTYMRVEGIDPMVLLKIKEKLLKRDILLGKIRYEIYTKYIELLDVTGKLSERPLKNYISVGMEEVKT